MTIATLNELHRSMSSATELVATMAGQGDADAEELLQYFTWSSFAVAGVLRRKIEESQKRLA